MKAKYDSIGIQYNQTRKADKFLVGRLAYYLAPEKDGIYLDIGCGTGNYTIALQAVNGKFTGVDPSEEMIKKARSGNQDIDWQLGTAEQTGFPSDWFDGVIASLTIHHWTNLETAFVEMARVMKRGAKMVIFTSTPEQMKGYWLNHYFPEMLVDSMRQMPSSQTVRNSLKQAGLKIVTKEPYHIKPDLQDLFLYSGKFDPELYFKPEVRSGISSFADLANAEEVAKGLEKLRQDIESHEFTQVAKSFENKLGDYLFIVAEKPV
ncbi:MAG: class I SAM-dependent methyltransferase [Bacteroidetes bacterium]|nr:MAG: class I SAM-dependent methyltransferase [Bacteroidota bacterium]